MKQKHYIKMSEFVRKYNHGEAIVQYANKIVTWIVYVSYIVMIAVLALERDSRIIRVLLVTGISFVLVSIFRHIIDSERPYTKYEFEPIVKKDKRGQSMPSRHVFSTFVIGMAFVYLLLPVGIFILAVGIFMCIARVVAGVHFPSDVLAGALLGILCGVIGFYVI